MKKVFLVLMGLGFLGTAWAQGKEVKIAFGLALPPYIISETNSGIEFDIIKQALAKKGYSIKALYLPFARIPGALADRSVDAAATINESSGVQGVFFSQSHITYQNVGIALADRKLKIQTPKDFSQYTVVAFQNAQTYLGKEFTAATQDKAKYSEIAKQNLQISMLYNKRVDLVVMDINIFTYYKAQVTDVDTKAPVQIFKPFSPTYYAVGFKDKKILEDFNSGLKELKSSGEYDRIFQKYLK